VARDRAVRPLRLPRHPVRPTLEVVAERAGVSRATASRVIRGAANVSDEAREAVLRAADELSYTVNLAARALASRRSDSVAFVVAEDENRMFVDPYFLGILRGAHAEIRAAGLQTLFVIASTPADRTQFEHYAGGGHVDGVLLISLHGDDALPRHLDALGVPTVLNGRPTGDATSVHWVDSDNRSGGRLATELLIARGARRIATISGPLDMSAGRDRLAGYRSALRRAGRPAAGRHVAEGDFSAERGARAMAELLDHDPGIDAVFAASDLTALGALQTLAARGRRVPDDVAVVGFDDIPEAQLTNPPLSTVRQPIEELGHTMARVLLGRLDGGTAPRTTLLPVELVRRGSA
jgi:DNA-binding LacI/PurR family transcriptional regulator